MMKFSALCIVAAASGLCGCANFDMNAPFMSSPLLVRPVPDGFVATQRAGVDKLANDPTWETIRGQELAEAVRLAGYCPGGIESVERIATAVRSLQIGTSRDLVYTGRCRQQMAPEGVPAVPAVPAVEEGPAAPESPAVPAAPAATQPRLFL